MTVEMADDEVAEEDSDFDMIEAAFGEEGNEIFMKMIARIQLTFCGIL